MNLLRVLLFAACFKQLSKRYPSMFDGARALAEIDQALAADTTEDVKVANNFRELQRYINGNMPPTPHYCTCDDRSNEYRARNDPDWWSCMDYVTAHASSVADA